MKDNAEIVQGLVQANRERYITMIGDLVRLSEDGSEPVQNLVAQWLREMECEVTVVSKPFGELSEEVRGAELLDPTVTDVNPHANVIGKCSGNGDGRSTILFSHADSPPPTGTENWTYPPFTPTTADGRIYGWGIADDKSGVVAMVAALDVVMKAQGKPAGDVVVVSCVSKNRTRGMAVALAHGVQGDGCIYLHPAESGDGLREVKTLTAGNLDFTIRVPGKLPPTKEPRHTPFAHMGENACDKAVLIAKALRSWDAERGSRVVDEEFDQQFGRSTNLLLGSISGGHGQKRIPEECALNYCITFPAPETVASVCAEIEAQIQTVVEGADWQGEAPKIEWLEGTEPAGVAPDHPLFQSVSAGIAAITGQRPKNYCGHASSDIRIPILYSGIPTVGYGPTSSEIAANGAVDESIDIKEYLDTISATALAVMNWAET